MSREPPRILVVDDEPDTCENLRDILGDLGYVVDTAHDGASALRMMVEQSFDVALLDLRMPGMDGLELYRRMRSLHSGTVGIIVTAYASPDTMQAANAAGAWHVLSKPVNIQKLLPLVSEAAELPLVLVVDDDKELCDTLWDVMRDQGLRVSVAYDVNQAERQLKAHDHQVVLIDLKLPQGDGGQVFQLVQATNPQAKTVFITGHRAEMTDLIDNVRSAGADAICYKPFNVQELIDTVRRLAK